MVLSPFQYGIDFGLIGGLQAMVGFLEVGLPGEQTSDETDMITRFMGTGHLKLLSGGTYRRSGSN